MRRFLVFPSRLTKIAVTKLVSATRMKIIRVRCLTNRVRLFPYAMHWQLCMTRQDLAVSVANLAAAFQNIRIFAWICGALDILLPKVGPYVECCSCSSTKTIHLSIGNQSHYWHILYTLTWLQRMWLREVSFASSMQRICADSRCCCLRAIGQKIFSLTLLLPAGAVKTGCKSY